MLAPSITRRLITEFAKRPDSAAAIPVELDALTEREREILRLVAAGVSNAEIAERLVISPLTAKTHVGWVLSKLDRHDRAQLVALVYETGFVTPRRSSSGRPARLPKTIVLRPSICQAVPWLVQRAAA